MTFNNLTTISTNTATSLHSHSLAIIFPVLIHSTAFSIQKTADIIILIFCNKTEALIIIKRKWFSLC